MNRLRHLQIASEAVSHALTEVSLAQQQLQKCLDRSEDEGSLGQKPEYQAGVLLAQARMGLAEGLKLLRMAADLAPDASGDGPSPATLDGED